MTWRLSFYKTNNDLPFTKSFQNIINDKLMKRIQIKSKTTKQKKYIPTEGPHSLSIIH